MTVDKTTGKRGKGSAKPQGAKAPKGKDRTDKTHEKAPSSPANVSETEGPINGTLVESDTLGGEPEGRKRFCGKKGRSGPPKGNRNGIRHGLTAGKLPADCAYVECQMNNLRRQLEDAVIEAKGQVTITDAAAIQTAVKWERHGALALRWLRTEGEDLSLGERLHFSREIARASTERDKAIANLELEYTYNRAPWEDE